MTIFFYDFISLWSSYHQIDATKWWKKCPLINYSHEIDAFLEHFALGRNTFFSHFDDFAQFTDEKCLKYSKNSKLSDISIFGSLQFSMESVIERERESFYCSIINVKCRYTLNTCAKWRICWCQRKAPKHKTDEEQSHSSQDRNSMCFKYTWIEIWINVELCRMRASKYWIAHIMKILSWMRLDSVNVVKIRLIEFFGSSMHIYSFLSKLENKLCVIACVTTNDISPL